MAYVTPTTRSTGYIVTASNWNELVNNWLASPNELVTTKADLVAATAANAFARVPAQATTGAVLVEDTTQSSGWKTSIIKRRAFVRMAEGTHSGGSTGKTVDTYRLGIADGVDAYVSFLHYLADHDNTSAVTVYIVWMPDTANAGNVVFYYEVQALTIGTTNIAAGSLSTIAPVATPAAQYRLTRTQLGTLAAGSHQGKICRLLAGRKSSDANDTYNGDTVHIIGAEFEYDAIIRTS